MAGLFSDCLDLVHWLNEELFIGVTVMKDPNSSKHRLVNFHQVKTPLLQCGNAGGLEFSVYLAAQAGLEQLVLVTNSQPSLSASFGRAD